jgi:hypothetical protein
MSFKPRHLKHFFSITIFSIFCLIAFLIISHKKTDRLHNISLDSYIKKYTKSNNNKVNTYMGQEFLNFVNFQTNPNETFFEVILKSRNHKREFEKFCKSYTLNPSKEEVKAFYYANQNLFIRTHPIDIEYLTDADFNKYFVVSDAEISKYIRTTFADKLKIYSIYKIPATSEMSNLKPKDVLGNLKYKEYITTVKSLNKDYNFLKSTKFNKFYYTTIENKKHYVLLISTQDNPQFNDKVFLNSVEKDMIEVKKTEFAGKLFSKIINANRNRIKIEDFIKNMNISENKLKYHSFKSEEDLLIPSLSDSLNKMVKESILTNPKNELLINIQEEKSGNFIIYSYILRKGRYIDLYDEYEKVEAIFKHEFLKQASIDFKETLERHDPNLKKLNLSHETGVAMFNKNIFQDSFLWKIFSTPIENFTEPVINFQDNQVCVGFVKKVIDINTEESESSNLNAEIKNSSRQTLINGMETYYKKISK